MRKRYKIFLAIIFILVILIAGITVYMKFFRKQSNGDTNKSNIVSDIKEYGYTLDDRDSELMKDEFNALEDILKADDIDYTEYAKSLSKLFIIDLYTIGNKINKYDIGGLEYLLDSEKDKFKNIILDSIYSTVLDNSNHNRKQELPEVKSVTVDDIKEEDYLIGEEYVNSYVLTISWDYIEDLGYDSKALITIVKEDHKLYVVEYSPVIDNAEESNE